MNNVWQIFYSAYNRIFDRHVYNGLWSAGTLSVITDPLTQVMQQLLTSNIQITAEFFSKFKTIFNELELDLSILQIESHRS